MKTAKFPERLEKDLAESYNFRQALKRLREGKSATPRSWVYEDKDPTEVLNSWLRILNSDEDEDLSKISEWDSSKQTKFAPQGEVAPFKNRQHTLSEYWEHLAPSDVFKSKEWELAKRVSISQLGFNHSGKPSPIEAVINRGLYEDKYNTSSGDPLFIKRKKPEAQEQAKLAAKDGSWKEYFPVLGSRASMGKTGSEARWIFMFPMSVNLVEQSFQQPLQDYLRQWTKKQVMSCSFFTPWDGYEQVQRAISQYGPSHLTKFGCDYSKMDQHFNIYHALECEAVIKHFFAPQYWDALHDSIHYTFNCSVVAPDYLILGPHAMPSGSGWTNFLETMFNFILVNYVKIKFGIKISFAMGIGDDQLWFIDENVSEKGVKFITDIFNSVGLEANPEKQEVSTDMASFLQRRSYAFWSPQQVKYAGVYPTVRALTSEIYPEFYHNEKEWTKNTFALRCLMILENCNKHPKFKEFCEFIARGNHNIIEFAKSSDAEILLVRHQAKKIANFIPTYNQEKAEANPLTFESLRIIRDMK